MVNRHIIGKTNTARVSHVTLTEYTPVTNGTNIIKHTTILTTHHLKLYKVTSLISFILISLISQKLPLTLLKRIQNHQIPS
jgi:hypothetical protein